MIRDISAGIEKLRYHLDSFRWGMSTLRRKCAPKLRGIAEWHEPYNVFELPAIREALGCETLDHGFHQPSYSNEELNDVVGLWNPSDHFDYSNHEISNPFILNEDEESLDKSTSSSGSATTLANISERRK